MRERLLILALALAAFAAALGAGFYLDDLAIANDPVITSPNGWFESFHWRQTRPLAWFSYWVNYQAGGDAPAGYHAVNLLLHLACVWLAYSTLSRIIPPRAAAIATALFALHPIQTEAVVYVFARPALLMTLFCLLSLQQWISARYWQACAWFGVALLSKEECVAFPLFLLWLHLMTGRDRAERRPIAVMLGLSVAAGIRLLWVSATTAGSGAGVQSGVTPFEYFVAQGFALWRYVRLLVVPYGFTIDSPLDPQPVWLGLLGWCAIAAIVIFAMRGASPVRPGFWIIAALLLIAPSSSFLPAQDLAADRRVYLPLLAIGCAAGLLIVRFPRWLPIALLATLALVTFRQTLIWRSGESLWREAVRLSPSKARPRIQLARQLPPGEALRILDEARMIAPDDPRIASEKGRVLLDSGNAAAALGEFGRALALTPDDARAMNNRGVALLRLNQREAAAADFRRALQRDPCLFDARWNLRNLGERTEAPPGCRYTPGQQRLMEQVKWTR